ERPPADLPDDVPDLLDLDPRRPGLDQEEVGVKRVVARRRVLALLGARPRLGQGGDRPVDPSAGRAPPAGLSAAGLAEQRAAGGPRERLLPPPRGPGQQEGGRQPSPLEAALEEALDPLVAEDVSERHPPSPPRSPGPRPRSGRAPRPRRGGPCRRAGASGPAPRTSAPGSRAGRAGGTRAPRLPAGRGPPACRRGPGLPRPRRRETG